MFHGIDRLGRFIVAYRRAGLESGVLDASPSFDALHPSGLDHHAHLR
jgi:hypothetical protein